MFEQLFGVKGKIQALEDFLKNPRGDRHPLYDPYDPWLGDLFFESSLFHVSGSGAWKQGYDRIVAGKLDLLPIEDKARFWLVLANSLDLTSAEEKTTEKHIFSAVLTGILSKTGDSGLSCSVLVDWWRQIKPSSYLEHVPARDGNLLEHIKSEILYLDPPGSFDCEVLERDALTLKVVTAKLLIHEGAKPESYAEECAAQADKLAEELKQDCHGRMKKLASMQESVAKPKRPLQEELAYLDEVNAWQTAVARIARTQHNFPQIDMRLFPKIGDTSLSFLNDSSLIKNRMHLMGRRHNLKHPLNFSG